MKPKLIGEYVHCLAMFKPQEMSDEAWESIPNEELGKVADWGACRINRSKIVAYNRSTVDKAVTVRWQGNSMTVSGTIEDWDAILGTTWRKD